MRVRVGSLEIIADLEWRPNTLLGTRGVASALSTDLASSQSF